MEPGQEGEAPKSEEVLKPEVLPPQNNSVEKADPSEIQALSQELAQTIVRLPQYKDAVFEAHLRKISGHGTLSNMIQFEAGNQQYAVELRDSGPDGSYVVLLVGKPGETQVNIKDADRWDKQVRLNYSPNEPNMTAANFYEKREKDDGTRVSAGISGNEGIAKSRQVLEQLKANLPQSEIQAPVSNPTSQIS